MAFIRVHDQKTSQEVNLNVNNIVGFMAALDEQNNPIEGSYISLVGGGTYHVSETVRTLQGFVRVATKNTPVTKSKG